MSLTTSVDNVTSASATATIAVANIAPLRVGEVIDGLALSVIDGLDMVWRGVQVPVASSLFGGGCYQRCIQGTSMPSARQRSIAA